MIRRLVWSVTLCGLLIAGLAGGQRTDAQSTSCPQGMQKLDIGISVSPPNVVHTPPYVAKALGLFAKHCVDATIVEFNGGTVGTIVAAIQQGTAIGNLTDIAISRGLKAHQIWQMALKPPQAYVVNGDVKTAIDLKGKRLSAAGGGVGGFNWLMGRDILKTVGLTPDDVQFIAGDTAGRLPGLIAGQVDGVVLHPEDTFLALQQKPGAHVLIPLAKLLPDFAFNAYGASDDLIAKNPQVLIGAVAAMIEADRIIYREKARVIPIIMDATQKSREAVESAYEQEVKDCIWAVNTGFDPKRTMWTYQHDIDDGDIAAGGKRLTFADIVDQTIPGQALKLAGGPQTIGDCKN
jgi:ABC-type nitrate/sulfonate/bicarbonate transport system substrate-binding protein